MCSKKPPAQSAINAILSLPVLTGVVSKDSVYTVAPTSDIRTFRLLTTKLSAEQMQDEYDHLSPTERMIARGNGYYLCTKKKGNMREQILAARSGKVRLSGELPSAKELASRYISPKGQTVSRTDQGDK